MNDIFPYGIELLSVQSYTDPNVILMLLGILFIVCSLFAIMLFANDDIDPVKILSIIIALVISGIICCVLAGTRFGIRKQRYSVVIPDDAPYNEIIKQFDIVDTDGKITVIVPRD